MNSRSFVLSIIIGILLIGCAGSKRMLDENGQLPTVSDMLNLLDDGEPVRPYSRYIYRIIEKNKSQAASGVISMPPVIKQDLRLEMSGSKLKIIADGSFLRSHDLRIGDSEEVPFGGGYSAGGKLAIIPEFLRPVEVEPQWFPGNAAVSIDSKCNFLIKLKSPQGTEVQKLVEFIDARTGLDRARCEILGTFQNIPQLRKLVLDLSNQGKYDARLSYVLRLNWSGTFALVRIIREVDFDIQKIPDPK